MVVAIAGSRERCSTLTRHALAWLAVGAFSASCGGRSTEVRDGNGAEGGSSGTSAGTSSSAGARNVPPARGVGGSQISGGSGGSGASGGGGTIARGGHGGSSASGAGSFETGGAAGTHGSAALGGSGGTAGGGLSNGGFGGTAGAHTNAGTGGNSRGGAGGRPGLGGAGAGGLGFEANGGRTFEVAGGDAVGPGGAAGASDGVLAGAVDLMLSPASTSVPGAGGRGCNAGTSGAFTYEIGGPGLSTLVPNGYDDVSVSCTLRADVSGGLAINGSISGTDQNGRKPIAFSVTGAVGSDGSTTASIAWFSPDTGPMSTLSALPGCTLVNVTRLNSDGLLADVDCPLIGPPDDTTSGCRVHGTFAFVGCSPD